MSSSLFDHLIENLPSSSTYSNVPKEDSVCFDEEPSFQATKAAEVKTTPRQAKPIRVQEKKIEPGSEGNWADYPEDPIEVETPQMPQVSYADLLANRGKASKPKTDNLAPFRNMFNSFVNDNKPKFDYFSDSQIEDIFRRAMALQVSASGLPTLTNDGYTTENKEAIKECTTRVTALKSELSFLSAVLKTSSYFSTGEAVQSSDQPYRGQRNRDVRRDEPKTGRGGQRNSNRRGKF